MVAAAHGSAGRSLFRWRFEVSEVSDIQDYLLLSPLRIIKKVGDHPSLDRAPSTTRSRLQQQHSRTKPLTPLRSCFAAPSVHPKTTSTRHYRPPIDDTRPRSYIENARIPAISVSLSLLASLSTLTGCTYSVPIRPTFKPRASTLEP